MNIFAELRRMANAHKATIESTDKLTDEQIRSAKQFIGNALKWDADSSAQMVIDALANKGYYE